MRSQRVWKPGSVLLLALIFPVIATAGDPSDNDLALDHPAAFEQLKTLAGEWKGTYSDDDAAVLFEVTSGGHTVVQTEFPGTAHEMRTLFWLEEGELVGRHFCVLGNQPAYRFVPSEEPGVLRFAFDGGSNLETNDHHAHDGVFRLGEDGSLESTWSFWKDGAEIEKNTLLVERQR